MALARTAYITTPAIKKIRAEIRVGDRSRVPVPFYLCRLGYGCVENTAPGVLRALLGMGRPCRCNGEGFR